MKKNGNSDTEALLDMMFEMGRMIRQAYIAEGAVELPLTQLETLRFIAEGAEPSMNTIAAALRITAPSASVIVESLVSAGYVTRKADSHDRRKVRLQVSKKGARVLLDTTKRKFEALRRILAPVSASDAKELRRILQTVITK